MLRRVPVGAEVGGQDQERLVVAEVGVRRDTRDGGRTRARSMIAGGDAGDMCGMEGLRRIERIRRVLPRRRAGGEGTLHDYLRRRELRLAFREARRVAQPGGAEV